MADPYALAVITASVRANRAGGTVSRWFRQRLKSHPDAQVDHIDLAALDLPDNLDGSGASEAFRKRIERADAYVVITPEYNHGYPGALKTALDTAYAEWWAKPAGFVCYGGVSGGLRAAEQLRTAVCAIPDRPRAPPPECYVS